MCSTVRRPSRAISGVSRAPGGPIAERHLRSRRAARTGVKPAAGRFWARDRFRNTAVCHTDKAMGAYIIRRILFMIPTMFGIMLVAFVVVQFAPGGPVEQVIAKLRG